MTSAVYVRAATRAMPDVHYLVLLVGVGIVGSFLLIRSKPSAWDGWLLVAGGLLTGFATLIKVSGLFVGVFLSLNWDRYYLPLIVSCKVLIGIGIWWVVVLLISLRSSGRGRKRGSPTTNVPRSAANV
jgi:tellurite resistance protein TehA-like permease